ncbi:MAG TPA: DUF6023 family protein [Actinoplanes sp.]
MTDERARGVALYAFAAALLVAGVIWWVRAAPPDARESDAQRWTTTALRLLPDQGIPAQADPVLRCPPSSTARRSTSSPRRWWRRRLRPGPAAVPVRLRAQLRHARLGHTVR